MNTAVLSRLLSNSTHTHTHCTVVMDRLQHFKPLPWNKPCMKPVLKKSKQMPDLKCYTNYSRKPKLPRSFTITQECYMVGKYQKRANTQLYSQNCHYFTDMLTPAVYITRYQQHNSQSVILITRTNTTHKLTYDWLPVFIMYLNQISQQKSLTANL